MILPDPVSLRQRCQALAVLDAILCPDWEFRLYSFNAHWSAGEQMASMRDGQGQEWFLLFGHFGAAIKGLDLSTDVAARGSVARQIASQLPETFHPFSREPAFRIDDVSFCYWRTPDDSKWREIIPPNSDGGASALLGLLTAVAEAYVAYARDYFERDIPVEAVRQVYSQAALSPALIATLNSEVDPDSLAGDLEEIGYPSV